MAKICKMNFVFFFFKKLLMAIYNECFERLGLGMWWIVMQPWNWLADLQSLAHVSIQFVWPNVATQLRTKNETKSHDFDATQHPNSWLGTLSGRLSRAGLDLLFSNLTLLFIHMVHNYWMPATETETHNSQPASIIKAVSQPDSANHVAPSKWSHSHHAAKRASLNTATEAHSQLAAHEYSCPSERGPDARIAPETNRIHPAAHLGANIARFQPKIWYNPSVKTIEQNRLFFGLEFRKILRESQIFMAQTVRTFFHCRKTRRWPRRSLFCLHHSCKTNGADKSWIFNPLNKLYGKTSWLLNWLEHTPIRQLRGHKATCGKAGIWTASQLATAISKAAQLARFSKHMRTGKSKSLNFSATKKNMIVFKFTNSKPKKKVIENFPKLVFQKLTDLLMCSIT